MSELPTTQNSEHPSAQYQEGSGNIDYIGETDRLFLEAQHGVAAAVNGEVIDIFNESKNTPAIWDLESAAAPISVENTSEIDTLTSITWLTNVGHIMERFQDDYLKAA